MTELITALDVGDLKKEESLLKDLKGTVRFYKIGLKLFIAREARLARS